MNGKILQSHITGVITNFMSEIEIRNQTTMNQEMFIN